MPELTEEQIQRFWSKVNKTPDGCWGWGGAITKRGYSVFSKTSNGKKTFYAHRISYELSKGPIPENLHIDHLCRVHHCVNPEHLEAVTQKENTLRGIGLCAINHKKTHCPQGHPYDEINTYFQPKRPGRKCKECNRIRGRKLYKENLVS